MELKYRSDDKLILKDDTRELSFLDLAKINGYQLEDNPNHHWVLYHCKELIKDKKIEFGFGTTYYTNGNLSQLYFGYVWDKFSGVQSLTFTCVSTVG